MVLPEHLSVKICCISPSDSEANRDGADAECFSLFLPHLKTLAQEIRSQNCLRFGTGGENIKFRDNSGTLVNLLTKTLLLRQLYSEQKKSSVSHFVI